MVLGIRGDTPVRHPVALKRAQACYNSGAIDYSFTCMPYKEKHRQRYHLIISLFR